MFDAANCKDEDSDAANGQFLNHDVYEHYKGFRYKILSVARHSETLEELVVYQAQHGKGDVWVRPLDMFLEIITIDGQSQPRFRLVQ